MKKWVVIAVIGGGLIGLFYLWSRPDPVLVSIISVERGTVEQTVANTRAGTVKACQRSRLSLPIGGQIAQLFVREPLPVCIQYQRYSPTHRGVRNELLWLE